VSDRISIRLELEAAFGESGIRKLEDAGILWLGAAADLPERIRGQLRGDEVGACLDDCAYLITDRIKPGQAPRVLLHELGEHYGLEDMLGEDGYNKVLLQVKDLYLRRDLQIVEAWSFVRRHYKAAEYSRTFMHEVIARAGQGAAQRMPFWKQMASGAKAWLIRLGLKKVENADDINALLRASLKRVIRSAGELKRIRSGEVFAFRPATRQMETEAFRRWSGGLRVVSPDDAWAWEGEPVVFRAFHGTTHTDIERIDTKPRKDDESGNYLGNGFYVSTSAKDAGANYAGEGPDLTSRIENAADQLRDSLYDDPDLAREVLDGYFKEMDLGLEVLEDGENEHLINEYGHDASKRFIRGQVKGGSEGVVMPLFVKFDKPFDIRPEGMRIFGHISYREDEDIETEEGLAVDLIETVREVAAQRGVDVSDATDKLHMQILEYGEFSGFEFWDEIRKPFSDAYDDYGRMMCAGDFLQEILREHGYDGIVMDAYAAFGKRVENGIGIKGMADLDQGTLHLMPFNSIQVKSATGNCGDFSIEDDRIMFSREEPTNNMRIGALPQREIV